MPLSSRHSASARNPGRQVMPRYLIERSFPNGLHVPASEEGAAACLSVVGNNEKDGVTWIHSYVTLDRRKTYCIYDGPSPEAVRKVAAANNLPVDRITPVRVLDPFFYFSAAVAEKVPA